MRAAPDPCRRLVVLAFACSMLATGVRASAAPLPPEFGGGFIPPNSMAKGHERRAALLAGQLFGNPLNSLLYCSWRGVERVRGGNESQLAACFDRWGAIYARSVGRIDNLPACVDAAAARQLLEDLALALNGTFWCQPPAGTPLPPEFGGLGFVPPDRATFLGEKGVARAFARLTRVTINCYRHGVDRVFDGNPTDIPDCLADAADDFVDKVARLVPPRSVVPACLLANTSALATLANAAAQALNPIVYCAE